MTRPYTDLTARIADESWSFGFDPRPHRMSGVRVLVLIGMALALAVDWIDGALS